MTNYPFLRAKVENLGLELNTIIHAKIAETRNSDIENLALAVRGYDGICVQNSNISDLTAWVAEHYDTVAAVCYHQAEQEIMQEIIVLGNLVLKIENALNMLTPKEQRVIDLRDVQKLVWADVERKTRLSRRQCSTIRREAMTKLQRVLYLNNEERLLLAEYIERGECDDD